MVGQGEEESPYRIAEEAFAINIRTDFGQAWRAFSLYN
jgi:hypothetical protein